MRDSVPQFLQGVFEFVGAGLDKPRLLHEKLSYIVPPDRRTQPIYFRGGNSSGEMIIAILMRDGAPMRYFAIGSKAGTHVPLAVVEDLPPDTRIDIFLAAPGGVAGFIMVDVGLVEI
ncbi:molybdopterin oxidoreductase [Methylocystis heyeri]|uniref:Molybdopterin oxidoreductase n=1 Tax=Methylocystis heyeri TaxID=391905 RepID=A0A6B8KE22_9HYPH|nr:molybdopterin oxidoreductase [Methylocystis heyeri]QGM44670.1 molybdopterin oxidoreductase [Methylocystis heyeri]